MKKKTEVRWSKTYTMERERTRKETGGLLTLSQKQEKEKKKNERDKSKFSLTVIYLFTLSKKLVPCRWRQISLLLLYRRRLSLTNFKTIRKSKTCR